MTGKNACICDAYDGLSCDEAGADCTMFHELHPNNAIDLATHGNWTRKVEMRDGVWLAPRHYYRGRRVPWLAWAMFS